MSFQPYHTVSSQTQFEITIKRSVFRAFLVSVQTKQQAQEFLDSLKREYWDAVHHCYAYRLGPLGLESRFSDDGEPSGTAGKPLLFALQRSKLSDCMVVVVRYYGGVKLGVGPLARAYAESAQGAIAACSTVLVEPRIQSPCTARMTTSQRSRVCLKRWVLNSKQRTAMLCHLM